jgi:pyruvate-ferredoxin/flavodoxin oxidoreductase
VASLGLQSHPHQAVKAFQEAAAHPGPSLLIAHSPCIAHGYDLEHGLEQQKLAADSGYWPLFRFDPRRAAAGENPFQLDSAPPKVDLGKFVRNEARFRLVEQKDPERFRALLDQCRADIQKHFAVYDALARRGGDPPVAAG